VTRDYFARLGIKRKAAERRVRQEIEIPQPPAAAVMADLLRLRRIRIGRNTKKFLTASRFSVRESEIE